MSFLTLEMITIECFSCHMPFQITVDFRNNMIATRESFYCPAGHSQWFPGKSKDDQIKELKDRLIAESARFDQMEASKRTLEKKIARVKNGVCISCNRSFENLQKHMRTKHHVRRHAKK